MSEEFICQSCEKIIVPEGDLQPVTICTDCYHDLSILRVIERDALHEQLIDSLRNELELARKIQDEAIKQTEILTKQLEDVKTQLVDIYFLHEFEPQYEDVIHPIARILNSLGVLAFDTGGQNDL